MVFNYINIVNVIVIVTIIKKYVIVITNLML